VPEEKRDKLDPMRKRGRLIGYGDDFDSEEMIGYKIVLEKDQSIIYCNDVIFSKIDTFEKLPNEIHNSSSSMDELFQDDIFEDQMSEDEINDQNVTSEDEINDHDVTSEDESSEDQISEISEKQENEDNTIVIKNENSVADDDSEVEDTEERGSNWWNVFGNISTANILPDGARRRAYATVSSTDIPSSLKKALECAESSHWKIAMDKEMESLKEKNAFKEIIDTLPKGSRAIKSRWVYVKKYDKNGRLDKYKARLVAKGFMEKYGIDYGDVFSPTTHSNTVRILCAIGANKNWEVFQDDQTTAFLNADLDEGKWIELPDGRFAFTMKALYGLKESPRKWFLMYRDFMLELGLTQSQVEPCLFYKDDLFVAVHVDDTMSTGKKHIVDEFRAKLKKRFKSGEGGKANYYLAMNITQTNDYIALDQKTYIEGKLEEYKAFLGDNDRFKASVPLKTNFQKILFDAEKSMEYDSEFPYRQMVGSLVYCAIMTRFDISAAVSVVSKFLEKPKKLHCEMVRQIYWYLRGSLDFKLIYNKRHNESKIQLAAYCDSSFANLENYESLSGYIICINETPVIWKCSRSKVIVKSTQEAEYVALTPLMTDLLWGRSLLNEIGFSQKIIEIYEDNEACIALANNPQSTSKTRHIQVTYHWIRQHLESGVAKLISIRTCDQLADILTKGLHRPKLYSSCKRLNLIPKCSGTDSGGELDRISNVDDV
jgi:hypothetical protein